MKNTFTLFFLFLCFGANAQNIIRGQVKDAIIKEAVISASVAIKNTTTGTITNEEGNFQLTAPKSSEVIISCLGYKTITIPSTDFNADIKIISLEQSEEILEEVMVTKTPLHQILEDIINASRAKFSKPIVLHTYYREFAKLDNKYTKFADGLLDYHVNGTTTKTKSDLIVKQNRSVMLDTKEEEDESSSFLKVQDAIPATYDFSILFNKILDDKKYEDYDFQLKSKKDKTGNELLSLYFEPKTDVEKALFKGSVTYDPQTKLIYEVDMAYDPLHIRFAKQINVLLFRLSFLDLKFKAAYKVINNNYLPSYSNRYMKIKVWTKKEEALYESKSDMITTDFEKDDLAYNKKDLFKKNFLYSKPSQYNDKFWQKNNAIVLTTEEEKIIAALENASTSPPK